MRNMRRLALFFACVAALLMAVACGEEKMVSAEEIAAACPEAIPWSEALDKVGQEATVHGRVVETKFVQRGVEQPTYLYIGKPASEPGGFRVEIRKPNLLNFPFPPDVEYKDKTICITGVVEAVEDGLLQIEAKRPSQIVVL